jgi:hypothetical protein
VGEDSNAVPPGDALNFNLSEEQQLLRDAVERFASERYDVPKRAAYRANPAGYSAENWAELAELGVLALPFDAEDGGLGGGVVELMTVMEALGRALAVEPVLEEIVISAGLVAALALQRKKRAGCPPSSRVKRIWRWRTSRGTRDSTLTTCGRRRVRRRAWLRSTAPSRSCPLAREPTPTSSRLARRVWTAEPPSGTTSSRRMRRVWSAARFA